MSPAARHTSQAGVSLIEVMAALAIVALMGAIAVVMLDARRSALDVAAERLTRALAEARQEALLSGDMIGFSAASDFGGWAFHEHRAGSWRVIDDHPALEAVRLPEGLTLEVRTGAIAPRGGEADADIPQVWFDPTGFDAPFTYMLADDETYRVVARLDDGRVRLGGEDDRMLAELDR